ncbi:DUF1850 domain-containing protein [Nocardiopsis sp. NRRL B-16309]|uniref:DUF1850 domain-containing protein n=1 Tax=Nocardiopsis sp. NRRL B-16309 TaxID=1519494 RepID=UPI001E5A7537|nr:DUF1850 domain-containing protein [Nocardiopsis sp. NRRL B-16309]
MGSASAVLRAAGAALAAAAVLLTATGSADTGTAWFSVRPTTPSADAPGPVALVPLAVGDRIELTHTHSVHRRPVYEVFSVSADAGLAMEEMRFDAHGANLPSGPETIGGVTTTFVRDGSGYVVDHHGRPIGTVRMVVGTADVDHRLAAGGREIRLLDLVGPGTVVELYVQAHRVAPSGE